MSHWNYRVFFKPKNGEQAEDLYEIREVYYKENGDIEGWTDSASAPIGETLDELKDDFEKMQKALSKPYLQEEHLTLKLEEEKE